MLFENVKTIIDRTVTERYYFKTQFCALGWLGQLESGYYVKAALLFSTDYGHPERK